MFLLGGLCPWFNVPFRGHLPGGSLSGGLCPGDLCPGVSVHGSICREKMTGTHPTRMLSCYHCVNTIIFEIHIRLLNEIADSPSFVRVSCH